MQALATECPDCEGEGILERTEAEDHRKWLEVFPRLCDRCNGTGKLANPRPSTESS
jgi:DnaJ-class molecular chaperone